MFHDALTGLPTRALLFDRFDQAMANATRRHQQVVLPFLDVDGFKYINDKLGHTVGDAILKQLPSRLCSCIRGSDTACRYGGDEVVILLPEHDGRRAVAATLDGDQQGNHPGYRKVDEPDPLAGLVEDVRSTRSQTANTCPRSRGGRPATRRLPPRTNLILIVPFAQRQSVL